MKKSTLGISALALAAIAGVAIAAEAPQHMNHGRMAEPTTRAEAQTAAGEMFDRIDTNHDGNISRDEFAAPRGKSDSGHDHSAAQAAPEHGQGEAMGHRMGGDRGRRGHGMMAMMLLRDADTNGDKAVTRPELTAAALKHFDAADANKDGKLTPEEKQAAMRTHMQQMRGRMAGHGGAGHDMGTMGGTPKQR